MDIKKEENDFNDWFDKQTINEGPDADLSLQRLWASLAWLAQAAKAQAVPELTDKMIVAIESEVESQLKASAIDADPFRLDGEKIWYAALEAQQPSSTSDCSDEP